VVARVSLNMLRSREVRREEPLDVRVPEPIIDRADGTDPEHQALLGDSVGAALLAVLETLSPPERLAFVLHDMFTVPFGEIAPIVDRSPEAARQLASRARRRVQGGTRCPTRTSTPSASGARRPRASAGRASTTTSPPATLGGRSGASPRSTAPPRGSWMMRRASCAIRTTVPCGGGRPATRGCVEPPSSARRGARGQLEAGGTVGVMSRALSGSWQCEQARYGSAGLPQERWTSSSAPASSSAPRCLSAQRMSPTITG
jgi:hypothetical protein